MTWFQALKQWNESKKKIDASHVWAIPRRGTPEHSAVHEIMRKAKEPAKEPARKPSSANIPAKPGKAKTAAKEDRKPDISDFFRR